MKSWRDIPEELRDMMCCHACDQPAYEKDLSLVLPCAHVVCLNCLEKVPDPELNGVKCAKCAATWKAPYLETLAFPKDTFSAALGNSLLGEGRRKDGPIKPQCALHPWEEEVSSYCKQCLLSVSDATVGQVLCGGAASFGRRPL